MCSKCKTCLEARKMGDIATALQLEGRQVSSPMAAQAWSACETCLEASSTRSAAVVLLPSVMGSSRRAVALSMRWRAARWRDVVERRTTWPRHRDCNGCGERRSEYDGGIGCDECS